ncbi:hypothetical protein [Novosphingobium sp. Gsoil 351]|uniref:hypothetical protein n=1 Tax=Novosphingobium sp. Gsoil 351 TaxID=2675225 RepID=UPI0012B4E680|nr:hypothetical protein [Novosphingobium sp. Gsoil 351]QGN56120.1 hypothetical protein GKE62_17775 [Novosphingobium sp. Gsoil 351]
MSSEPVQRAPRTGWAALARHGRPPGNGKLVLRMARVIAWAEAEDDNSVPEVAVWLKTEASPTVHHATLFKDLITAGLSLEKTVLASEY